MQTLDCRHCRRTFYKLEHLQRHERSHTGARPFVCTLCKRAFGRQDSLYRHQRLHSRADVQPYASPSPSNGSQLASSEGGFDPEIEARGEAHSLNAPPNDREALWTRPVPPACGDQLLKPVQSNIQAVDQAGDSAQLDYELIWPDSENLFQTILSLGSTGHQQSLGLSPSTPSALNFQSESTRFGHQPASIDPIPADGNNQVVDGVSKMIHLQSSSVTAAVHMNAINSVFLDESLHMFFLRFIPTFPVLHRPTFVFRDCLQPLLLNAMAIGSLYLGHANAVAQGEVLWRLAHTALATTWQDMISHRGPYDERPGVQLLVTSLLGQIYGILSKNQTIRMTSQTFHVLAFVWAKQCGIAIPDIPTFEMSSPMENTEYEKDRRWRQWVARTIQQRALLAHYSLDGLISRMMGTATSERHIATRLSLRFDDSAFVAQTADEFLIAMQMTQNQAPTLSFQSILHQLILPNNQLDLTEFYISAFNIMVLQEGLQSVLDDNEEDHVGLDYIREGQHIGHALLRIHEKMSSDASLPTAEKLEASLRWHAVCLEAITNTSKLCRMICRTHNIKQNLWTNDENLKLTINPSRWPHTAAGRRALLHAVAIQGIIEDLPRGRAHAIHMPSSLLASATICATFCFAGVITVNLPSTVSWGEVVTPSSGDDSNEEQNSQSPTARFIRGEFDSGTIAFGAYRNLAYEFNSMQKLFGCLATQWGVASQMAPIIRQWAEMLH